MFYIIMSDHNNVLTKCVEPIECLICFVKCHSPCKLYLLCQCDYKVHWKCYKRWFKLKQECIICHAQAFPAQCRGTTLDWYDQTKFDIARVRYRFYKGAKDIFGELAILKILVVCCLLYTWYCNLVIKSDSIENN